MKKWFLTLWQRIRSKFIGEAPPWIGKDEYKVPFHITDTDLERIEEVRRLHGVE